MTASEPLRRLRRQRNTRAVHRLGDRVLFEFVDELVRHHPCIADDIDRRLARYSSLDTALLRSVGADKFAPRPLRVVGGQR